MTIFSLPHWNWSLLTLFLVVFFLVGFALYMAGYAAGSRQDKDSKKRSRSTLGGTFSEQIAPFLPDFPPDLKASEARFIGKPIDLIVFKGMDEGSISEVVFVEIKSGGSQLSLNERTLKSAVDAKRVRWEKYHVPDEVAKITDMSP